MKRTHFLTICMLLFLAFTSNAKNDFQTVQSLKLPFEPSQQKYAHTSDFEYFLCSTKTDMLMFNGLSGKILWQINFDKEMSNKKFANQYWNKFANVVLVFDEDKKSSVAKKYFIDGSTGKLLWESDKYVSDYGQYKLSTGFSNFFDYETNGVLLPTKENVDFVNIRTGEVLWSKKFELDGKAKKFDCYIMKYYDLVRIQNGDETETYLTTKEGKVVTDIEPYFNRKKFISDRAYVAMVTIPEHNMYVALQGASSVGYGLLGVEMAKRKFQLVAYNESNNDVIWAKEYVLPYRVDIYDNTPIIDLYYSDNTIFLMHDEQAIGGGKNANENGLKVIDVKTGDLKWQTRFTTSETKSSGLTKYYQTKFPAPNPYVFENKVYVVNKKENVIECFDLESGTQIWKSDEFPDAQVIPAITVNKDVILLVHGKPTLKNVSISSSKGTTYKREFNAKDKYGLIGYDASTGKALWRADKFKSVKDKFSYVAGAEVIGDKVFVATNKNMHVVNISEGKVETSVPLAASKVGDAWEMEYFPAQNEFIVKCTKGIVKVDDQCKQVQGVLKSTNVMFYSPAVSIPIDDDYEDYFIYTKGDTKKGVMKTFSPVNLRSMTLSGAIDAEILNDKIEHFNYGAEMFFLTDGPNITIYKTK